MATPAPGQRIKAFILFTLKHDGDIVSNDGRAGTMLNERLATRGVTQSGSSVSAARRALEDEGLISVEMTATRVSSIKLLSLGDYVDPWSEEGEATYATKTTKSTTSGAMTLDRARRTIEALPVTDRLMLAGEIIDNAVGELAEKDEKLRKFGEMLRGV